MDPQPKRILVVDDNADLALLTERVLKDKGFHAVRAGNGSEALAAIKAEPPDLVLLDIDMPELDGWGFLEKLDASPRPPVAFVSGNFDFDAFSKGTRAGVVAFVAKPIHYNALIATCQRIFSTPKKRPEQPGDNRRRGERRQLLVRVDVISSTGSHRVIGELRDLSLGGAQVITMGPLEIGAKVLFSLDAAVTGEPMTFDSEVRWQQQLPDGFAHGLELLDLGPEQTERLYAVVG
jgi:DNA-binding NtrC family response regulator